MNWIITIHLKLNIYPTAHTTKKILDNHRFVLCFFGFLNYISVLTSNGKLLGLPSAQ